MVEYPVLRRFEKLKNKVLKIKKEPYVFQLILVEISNIMKKPYYLILNYYSYPKFRLIHIPNSLSSLPAHGASHRFSAPT